ncbi:Hpt domain-containing protein [Sulfurimonas sp.]|uniref:Hpt domain-containing protein n=1 Tax=Sulfurimonas sp. TaxID=2022749 RepID=UPI00262F47C4|nr:Hpt domain-containing protein [Sulfurimonas sp.]MCW8894655.1 Hpt domain-containing protein [Sulfurimonas sp.]
MLIYNYKKEFLGIDESDLEALGLSDLAQLRAEAGDFADLFVKTPGHIHNFKHVHWIDYITCNETGVAPKVIIHVKNKNYTSNIDVKTIYLVDSPSKKAYIVNLTNLRPLSHTQSEKISIDVSQRPAPTAMTEPVELFTTPGSIVHEESQEASFDPYESDLSDTPSNLVEDIYESDIPPEDFASDEPLDIDFGDEEIEVEDFQKSETQATPEPQAVAEDKIQVDENDPFANYVFDPHIASEELGLPTDLVEEFIQDFISQANSFKEELYEATQRTDLDSVKIQSHKLKGVAANLRIEDALDALTIINTSDDTSVISHNLDRLYRIINKLSNTGAAVNPTPDIQKETTEEDEEDFILSFKDDEAKPDVEADEISFADDIPAAKIEIDDSQVPESIDIPELEDDMFLKQDDSTIQSEVADEDLSILDDVYDTQEVLDTTMPYDKELVANDIGLDIDSFNELFEDYINESRELTTSMKNALTDDDFNAYKHYAIKLKGMSDNMRVNNFNDDLEAIINSSDISATADSLDNIILKLEQISTTGDK